MILASKAAWAGIVFLLLTRGSQGHTRRYSLRETISAKRCPRSPIGTTSSRCSEACGIKHTIAGKSMVYSVSEPERVFADFRRLRICQ